MEQMDAVMEELATKLVELTREGTTIEGVIAEAGDYFVQFAGGTDDIAIETVSNDFLPEDRQLNDYQMALLYGMGFEYDEEAAEGSNLFMEYELEEDDAWEEETLREFALQAVALLHYLFGQPATAITVRTI
jgi:hypothetical protein